MDTGSIAFYPLVINFNGGKEDDQKDFFEVWITTVDGYHASNYSNACNGDFSMAASWWRFAQWSDLFLCI
jgi:hypothetical protein